MTRAVIDAQRLSSTQCADMHDIATIFSSLLNQDIATICFKMRRPFSKEQGNRLHSIQYDQGSH